MAFPKPLKIDPARLVVDDDKVIDAAHKDWYFQYDGRDETRYVFLEGSGLLALLDAGEDLVIGEIGFGTGLTYQLVREAMAACGYQGRMRYIGVEGRPLSAEQARTVNALRPEPLHWHPPSERPRAGFVRASDELLLLHGDAADALSRLSAGVDLWFLDGFSPAKNPDAWTPEIFAQLARLSRPGARLATFTAAGDVRRGLESAGFETTKRSGWAKKREHLTARFEGTWTARPQPASPLIIAGAGIAGLTLALEARRLGWPAILHGTGEAAQGSAVPHALVNYRPSGDVGPLGQLRRAGFFHLSDYAANARFGVDALVSDAKLRQRWDSETDVEHQWITADRVRVPAALSLDTAAFRARVLEQVDHRPESLTKLPNVGPVVLAAGLGTAALLEGLSLRANRGQQDLLSLDQPLTHPLNFGRLLLPADSEGQAWLGASFDRDPPTDWQHPRSSDSADNLARLRAALPDLAARAAGRTWVGLRATTPDHLPLAGWHSDYLGILTGLGSKGYLYAPILASSLLSQALALPLPVERWVWEALTPLRHSQSLSQHLAGKT